MRRHVLSSSRLAAQRCRYGTKSHQLPIISIQNSTFYRHRRNDSHPDLPKANPALFEGLNFELASFPETPSHWAIIGASSSGKTTFLQVLRDQHISDPSSSRSYPYLAERVDGRRPRLAVQAIKQVGFDGEIGGQAPKGAYLSARYESRREETDYSVLDYLKGNTELNPFQKHEEDGYRAEDLAWVLSNLRLDELKDMPLSNLSNGQTRRARIAKALLDKPEVLLLDEPFMGLDPQTLVSLSPLLHELAKKNSPRLVLSLRPQDPIPDWITHLIFLSGNCEVAFQGPKEVVLGQLVDHMRQVEDGKVKSGTQIPLLAKHEIGRRLTKSGVEDPKWSTDFAAKPKVASGISEDVQKREALVEMEGVHVKYGTKSVLGAWKQSAEDQRTGLWWNVRRNSRWGIFGPNGSGKTTMLSLISSDHPQTYSQPVRLFGRSRLPERGRPGISIFDVQARMGQSSPEIHNHIPRDLTLRQVLENAWSDTFRGFPKWETPEEKEAARVRVDRCLQWFEPNLRSGADALPRTERAEAASSTSNLRESVEERLREKPCWADELLFGGLPFSSQRVALFLRAVVKQPEIVILDEAFSGMDDGVRDRCLLFLSHGEEKRLASPPGTSGKGQRVLVDSNIGKSNMVVHSGLNSEQALICISHIKEEVPECVKDWICLPEANSGNPPRIGKLDGALDERGWKSIWGVGS